MPIVNPNEHIPHLIVWSTFSIFAACSNAVLLAVLLISQRRDANWVLVNLISIFIVASSTGSLLIWTGHDLDSQPPYGLCLLNASMSVANVPLMAGSAIAIVLEVWGSVMIACHPSWQPALQWTRRKSFLLALPYISGIPLLIAALVIGTRMPEKVYRGSPFYCVVDNAVLEDASLGFGAAYTFLCLALSGWTSLNLITARWRVRRIIEYPGVSYSFVCRTLFFSIFVSVAFVVGVVDLFMAFTTIIPDIALSTCSVAVFFIFSASKPIIRFVFGCQRGKCFEPMSSTPKSLRSDLESVEHQVTEKPRASSHTATTTSSSSVEPKSG